MASATNPETVICTFRVRPDRLDEFLELLDRHWPVLQRLDLVTDKPEQQFVRTDGDASEPVVISIFEWASAEASSLAHTQPDVAEIWMAMEPMCEARDGRPSMEFPHFRPRP